MKASHSHEASDFLLGNFFPFPLVTDEESPDVDDILRAEGYDLRLLTEEAQACK